jgi:hypothetical protein
MAISSAIGALVLVLSKDLGWKAERRTNYQELFNEKLSS